MLCKRNIHYFVVTFTMKTFAVFVILCIIFLQTISLPVDTGCPPPKIPTESTTNNDTIEVPFPLVFHDVDSMIKILQMPQFNTFGAVQELLRVYHQAEKNKEEFVKLGGKKNHPLIALEGLAGSGKSTLGNSLAKNINGVQIHSPSNTVDHLRNSFLNNTLLDNIYHRFAHYVTALEVQLLLKDSPVILDRYWHSSATYAVGRAAYNTQGKYVLPPKGDKLYNWPDDLFKPDLVLFLHVDENTRLQRIYKRTNDDIDRLKGEEHAKIKRKFGRNEELLQKCPEYRNNIILAYKNMAKPGVTIINANLSQEDVLKEAYSKVQPLLK